MFDWDLHIDEWIHQGRGAGWVDIHLSNTQAWVRNSTPSQVFRWIVSTHHFEKPSKIYIMLLIIKICKFGFREIIEIRYVENDVWIGLVNS